MAEPFVELAEEKSNAAPTISLSVILKRASTSWRTVVRAAVVGVVAGLALAFLLPKEYTAEATFLPPNSVSSGLSAMLGQLSSIGSLGGGASLLGGMKQPGDIYVGLMSSKFVQQALITKFDLKRVYKVKRESQAEKILEKHTDISTSPKDPIIHIKVTDTNAERARDIANAYLDQLAEANNKLVLTDASQRRVFFEQQLVKAKDDLANAEVTLKSIQEKSGLVAPTGQVQVELQSIASLRAEIASREVQLAALRQSATDQNPRVIELRSSIGNLESQLTTLQKGNSSSSMANLPSAGLDFVRATREVKYRETLFELIARQYETAKLEESKQGPILQVLDKATTPDMRSGPPRVLIVIGFAVIAPLLTVLYLLFDVRGFYSRLQ